MDITEVILYFANMKAQEKANMKYLSSEMIAENLKSFVQLTVLI
jgi:hypothetical protein